MTRNRHPSRTLTTSLPTVLLMSACSGHTGTRGASQSGRSAPNTLSRTHPLKVQYVHTYAGEGSGPVHESMTVMTDGQGGARGTCEAGRQTHRSCYRPGRSSPGGGEPREGSRDAYSWPSTVFDCFHCDLDGPGCAGGRPGKRLHGDRDVRCSRERWQRWYRDCWVCRRHLARRRHRYRQRTGDNHDTGWPLHFPGSGRWLGGGFAHDLWHSDGG